MNVERYIAVYDKDDDSLVADIRIELGPEVLRDVFEIDKTDDPDAYKPYQITASQFEQLKKLLPELEKFRFNEVRMRLECFSIE